MKITRITDKKVSLRRTIDTGTEEQRKIVQSIISTVRSDGDKALFSVTFKLDNDTLSNVSVQEKSALSPSDRTVEIID